MEDGFVKKKRQVHSGVPDLDNLLDGLSIGDNVVWHDDAGNLASSFCLSFLRTSLAEEKPVIYVSFDRSPKNVLEKLGDMSDHPNLTVLDAFTCGKGESSPIFMRFYEETENKPGCRVICVEKPYLVDAVSEILYDVHGTLEGDVRLVFESITGMQEVWGGEDAIVKFYSRSCPRLYELETIAYWIIEKMAHSQKAKARINQVAQVAIDLSIRRGTTYLTVLKAENRGTQDIDKPCRYWIKDDDISFETEKSGKAQLDLGLRIKALRNKRGMSQSELAKLVGVTPSTISQIETNTIYPSVPALIKIAEILGVHVGSLFQEGPDMRDAFVYPAHNATSMSYPDVPQGSFEGKLLTPPDFEGRMEPHLVEIMPHETLSSHFFSHKGEEMGYLLAGELEVQIKGTVRSMKAGDTIYLTTEAPAEWKNRAADVARLLWVKAR
jgi:transcriptional regulator with XRE-family HTH domain